MKWHFQNTILLFGSKKTPERHLWAVIPPAGLDWLLGCPQASLKAGQLALGF